MIDHEIRSYLNEVIGNEHMAHDTRLLAIVALELHRLKHRLDNLADIIDRGPA